MIKTEKELRKRLIAKRQLVRDKLNLLKQGEIVQQKALTPLTKHLQNIENLIVSSDRKKTLPTNQTNEQNDKEEEEEAEEGEKEEKVQETQLNVPSTSKQQHFGEEEVFTNEDDDELGDYTDDDDEEKSIKTTDLNTQIDSKVLKEYLDQYKPLPRKYIHDILTDTEDKFDRKYGVRHNNLDESFMIGNSQLFIHNSDIIVHNKQYKGTTGLYELLFKKTPHNYTKDDLKAYKEILIKTNAHKRHYQSNQQVDGSRLPKYKKIIAPLVLGRGSKSFSSGGSLLKEVKKNSSVDFVYWDDPNELVDRLRLLVGSQEAGNLNHRNEIISIIEELRESGIIE